MANVLGVYNPIFYANEALIALENALGMAGRVHRGFELERNSFNLGEVINIRRPSVFSAQDAPSSAQDVETGTEAITLAFWKEVKFKLTDRELAFTGEKIIEDHIRPAAYALADDIDSRLATKFTDIPWVVQGASPLVVADITATRQRMALNKVPLQDIGRLHLMVDPVGESELLNLTAFSQQQGAGDVGVNTQLRGSLGTKFGLEVFMNQNVATFAKGTQADFGGTVTGAHAKGVNSLVLGALTDTQTITAGSTFSLAGGDTQKYAVTALATVSGTAVTVSISPSLQVALAGAEVITFDDMDSSDGEAQNLAFHRNAFALVLAPLPEIGNQLGANVVTVSDPITGLSLRSRMYYVGNSSEVHVALDVLYGLETLDANLAARLSA